MIYEHHDTSARERERERERGRERERDRERQRKTERNLLLTLLLLLLLLRRRRRRPRTRPHTDRCTPTVLRRGDPRRPGAVTRDDVLFQIGKAGSDTFALDVAYPLSPLQAFGIAVATLPPELAVP